MSLWHAVVPSLSLLPHHGRAPPALSHATPITSAAGTVPAVGVASEHSAQDGQREGGRMRERREKQDTSETKGQAGREGSALNLTTMAWPDAGHCPEGASWCSRLMFSSAGVRPVSTRSWTHSESTSTQGPSSRRWQQTESPGAPCSQLFPPSALSALTFTQQAGSSTRPGIEGIWVGRHQPHRKKSFCVFGGRQCWGG